MTSNDPQRLAIVIPTLNEEANLPRLLKSLTDQGADRIVVSDGGSTDATIEVARAAGVEVRDLGQRGRGGQIAAAIAHLDEDIILIAHADMVFPSGAVAVARAALARYPLAPGGCLGHRFDERGWTYWLVEIFDYFRARWTGIAYGDQAQFFRRHLLPRLGGFPDQPILEDLEFSLRLRRLGQPLYLHYPVQVSARRFARLGYWRTIAINLWLRRVYRRQGLAACQQLYEHYYRRGDGRFLS